LLDEGKIPGAGIAVFRDGKPLWIGGVGRADKANDRRVDADTRFAIGSITKTFTAIAVLQLVERGQLRLEDEVAKLLPELPIDNPWQASDPVRVVHLLEHTAGFDDMHFRNMLALPGHSAAQEVARFAAELRVRWRPGERMSYSNPGYGLLGLLLEKVSGREQREYISNEVLTPLGMLDTVWTREQAGPALAIGYEHETGAPAPWDVVSMPAAGSLISSPADLAKLLGYFLSDGASAPTLLEPESLARMQRTETTLVARAGLQVGYGAGNYYSERAGLPLRGHSGGIEGFYSNLAYNRELGIGYVLLVNTLGGEEQLKTLQNELLELLAAGKRKPPAAAAVPADPQWNGWYAMSNPRNQLLGGIESLLNAGYISAEGRRFRITHPWHIDSVEFDALPDQQIRDTDDRHANGLFARDSDGRRVMVTDNHVFIEGSFATVALPTYALAAALLLLLSCLLFAPVWIVRAWRGKLRGLPRWGVRAWPLAAATSLVITLWLSFGLSLAELVAAQPNARMVGISAGSWAFAGFGLIGLTQTLRHWPRLGARTARVHTLLASTAAVGLALWLWRIDLLGVRLWAW